MKRLRYLEKTPETGANINTARIGNSSFSGADWRIRVFETLIGCEKRGRNDRIGTGFLSRHGP